MTVDELLARIETEYYPQRIWSPHWETSCPCFWGQVLVNDVLVFAHGNCWRVSNHIAEDMQDLYVWQEPGPKLRRPDLLRIAYALKHRLDRQEWYNDYYLELDAPDG